MILGFSHLTHATGDAAAAMEGWRARGWTPAWSALGVESAPEKWPLMAHPARSHDLHLLDGPVRVEVIAHDTGSAPVAGRLRLPDGASVVEIATRDLEAERRFLREALRFADGEGDVMTFSGRMPSWSVAVRPVLDAAAPLDPPLDVEGLSCLAFLSTAPEDDAEAMRAFGARDVGRSFRVTVNGRRLRVLMLRSPDGTPIELVKVETTP